MEGGESCTGNRNPCVGRLAWKDARARVPGAEVRRERGDPVIQHQCYANYFVVTCDRCGRLDSVGTVKTAAQAKQVAHRCFSWEMDTPDGDLCDRCVEESRGGTPRWGRADSFIVWEARR
jgi:hypothetical protein